MLKKRLTSLLLLIVSLSSFSLMAEENVEYTEISDDHKDLLIRDGYQEASFTNISSRFEKCAVNTFLGDLSNGNYFVRFDQNQQVTNEKLVFNRLSQYSDNTQITSSTRSKYTATADYKNSVHEEWSCTETQEHSQTSDFTLTLQPRRGIESSSTTDIRKSYFDVGDNIRLRTSTHDSSSQYADWDDFNRSTGEFIYDTQGRELQHQINDLSGGLQSTYCTYYLGTNIFKKSYSGLFSCVDKWNEENPEGPISTEPVSSNICGEHGENACVEDSNLICRDGCRVDYNWPDGDTYNCWCPADVRETANNTDVISRRDRVIPRRRIELGDDACGEHGEPMCFDINLREAVCNEGCIVDKNWENEEYGFNCWCPLESR